MKFENTFSIPAPAAQAWQVLLDLERIAPCVPGATITGRDGDDFRGKIKVKLGPVSLSYNGTIKIASQDEAAGIAVLEGGGREARGNGTAKATITCRLVENAGVTDVFVETELAITGKPAQFGRGALADVAGTLIGTFATNLAAEITAGAPVEPESASADGKVEDTSSAESAAVAAPRASAAPIDLLAASGMGGAARCGAIAVTAVLLTVLLLLRRRHRAGGGHESRE
ncbi:SRPBCC family protein [Nocardia vinacea]|uniref:SRPBCC family protein n=1 Tax=Nocardia vinacea TaxID=96468 RepID=A0ABZ1YWG4_9NOCA|nr:SRPBCC family protein [Nocardia vinacea]